MTTSELPVMQNAPDGGGMEIYNNTVITAEIPCNHRGYIIRGMPANVFNDKLTTAIQFHYSLFTKKNVYIQISNCAPSELMMKCIYYDQTGCDDYFKPWAMIRVPIRKPN